MSAPAPDWSNYSPPQLACLVHLSFTMPVHVSYLTRRLDVRMTTVTALEKKGLVKRHYLSEGSISAPIPVVTLTQFGDAVRTDYVSWHRGLKSKLGRLPPAMDAIAEARP